VNHPIERTVRLIAALSGERADGEAAAIARELADSAPPSRVADALVDAVEIGPPRASWIDAHWIIGTATATLFAIVGASFGLSAIREAFQLEWAWVPWLPSAVLPLLATALAMEIRDRARAAEEKNEVAAVTFALCLLRARVAEPSARRAAGYLTGVETEAYGTAMAAPTRAGKLGVGVAAIAAVVIFWVGYFAAFGAAAIGGAWQ
jgi:hypothetical protein